MSQAFAVSQHADGVYMVEGPASNWVLLTDGAQFTLIDGGYPADTGLVLESIRHIGRHPQEAQAMLITHGHVDHTGAANYFAEQFGTPVLSAREEHGQMLGTERFQVTPRQILLRAWKPAALSWMMHVIRSGGAKGTVVPTAATWDATALAALPGAPVAVPTPGHTPGHTVFHLPGAEALIAGDAMVTGHALSKSVGPQMLHPMFHHDVDQAYSSLSTLEGIPASTILPGHGKAYKGNPSEAVLLIRSQNR